MGGPGVSGIPEVQQTSFEVDKSVQPAFISDSTFAGTLFIKDVEHLERVRPDVVILGVPLEWGECSAGQSFGPGTIRRLSAGKYAGGSHVELGVSPFELLRVGDYGDVPVSRSDVEGAFENTTSRVREILSVGATPFIMGGDHSLTYAALRAYCQHHQGNIGLIHFDAHIDVVDRWGCEEYSCASWLRRSVEEFPNLPGVNYTMIGARGFWPEDGDVKWMKDQDMQVFTMVDVEEMGIDACVDQALARAWAGTEAVYLTFDGDALDPAYAPGIGLPTPGGLTTREAVRAVRSILRTGVSGMDLVELTPYQENEAQTSTYLAVALLMEALSGLAMNRLEQA